MPHPPHLLSRSLTRPAECRRQSVRKTIRDLARAEMRATTMTGDGAVTGRGTLLRGASAKSISSHAGAGNTTQHSTAQHTLQPPSPLSVITFWASSTLSGETHSTDKSERMRSAVGGAHTFARTHVSSRKGEEKSEKGRQAPNLNSPSPHRVHKKLVPPLRRFGRRRRRRRRRLLI